MMPFPGSQRHHQVQRDAAYPCSCDRGLTARGAAHGRDGKSRFIADTAIRAASLAVLHARGGITLVTSVVADLAGMWRHVPGHERCVATAQSRCLQLIVGEAIKNFFNHKSLNHNETYPKLL